MHFPTAVHAFRCPALWAVLGFCVLGAGCKKAAAFPGANGKPIQVELPPQPDYAFEAKGLRLRITTDEGLNRSGERAHAMLLVVYQLSDVNAFREKAKDAPGLQALLEAGPFDASVTAADRIFLQPGAEQVVILDRAQNSKWLAVAAGYYEPRPGGATRFGFLPATAGSPLGGVERLEICLELRLGPDGIRDFALAASRKGSS